MGAIKKEVLRLFLPLLLLLVVPFPGNARKHVHQASPLCVISEDTMDCNYEGIDDHIQMDKLGGEVGEKIKTVIISNAVEITVTGTHCINIHLINITQATFLKPTTCNNFDELSLKVVNSKINAVPKYVTSVEIEDSYSGWFDSDKQFRFISILRSRIGTLNLDRPLGSGTTTRIEDSTVVSLEELKLENKAQIYIVNTTVSTLRANSIQLTNAMSNLYINSFDNEKRETASSKVKPSTPVVEAKPKVEKVPPGVPPPDIKLRKPREPSTFFLWFIPTMVAVLEAMIIMVNCTNWFPSLKSKRPDPTIEDGAKRVSSPVQESDRPGYYYNQGVQSSIFFGNDGYQKNVNKRSTGKDF